MTWIIISVCAIYLYMIFYLYQLFRNWFDRLQIFYTHDQGRQIWCGISALFWPIGFIINAATFYGRRDFINKDV
jgi:hypothetical protein